MNYILYNPLADNGNGKENARVQAEKLLPGETVVYLDVTESDLYSVLKKAAAEDRVVLAGGDGTLWHAANSLNGRPLPHPLHYIPCGSGNDFMADVREREGSEMILLDPYLKDLPSVTVKGKRCLFLNNVGFGIDGYCCEVGDKLRAKSPNEKINYAGIAIKGLLFHFKPRSAKVTVDGVTHIYQHVWLAPAMNGRYYGGGMMVAPEQDRLNAGRRLSVVIMHKKSKLKTLMVFPSIFKGEHVKHTEMVEVLTGHRIHVEFDQPTALQIDGETVLGVTEYTAEAAVVKEL